MQNKKSKKTILIISIAILVLAAVFIFLKKSQEQKIWDKNTWQAIFLNNDQVYFGKIKDITNENIDFIDVYYLQRGNNEIMGSATLNLIKLGSEFHGPSDEMIITRSNVLFWENLRADSKVVKTINAINN